MQPNTIGLICTILAPAFYAGMSIASKLAGAHMSIWQVSFGRFILGLLVIPVIVRMRGLGLWGRRRLLLTLRGVCGAAAFLLLVAAFQRISLTLAMVLFYTYPAFTAMLSPWVAGESAKRSAWIFIAGAFEMDCSLNL